MLASFSSLSTHGPHQRSHNHTHHTSTPNAHTHDTHRLSHCSSTFPPTAYRPPTPTSTPTHPHQKFTPHLNTPSSSSYPPSILQPPRQIFSSTPTTAILYVLYDHSLVTFYLLHPTSFYYLHLSSIQHLRHQTQSTSSRQITASWLCDATNLSSQSLTPTPTRKPCAPLLVNSPNHVGLCYKIFYSSRVNFQFLNPSRYFPEPLVERACCSQHSRACRDQKSRTLFVSFEAHAVVPQPRHFFTTHTTFRPRHNRTCISRVFVSYVALRPVTDCARDILHSCPCHWADPRRRRIGCGDRHWTS